MGKTRVLSFGDLYSTMAETTLNSWKLFIKYKLFETELPSDYIPLIAKRFNIHGRNERRCVFSPETEKNIEWLDNFFKEYVCTPNMTLEFLLNEMSKGVFQLYAPSDYADMEPYQKKELDYAFEIIKTTTEVMIQLKELSDEINKNKTITNLALGCYDKRNPIESFKSWMKPITDKDNPYLIKSFFEFGGIIRQDFLHRSANLGFHNGVYDIWDLIKKSIQGEITAKNIDWTYKDKTIRNAIKDGTELNIYQIITYQVVQLFSGEELIPYTRIRNTIRDGKHDTRGVMEDAFPDNEELQNFLNDIPTHSLNDMQSFLKNDKLIQKNRISDSKEEDLDQVIWDFIVNEDRIDYDKADNIVEKIKKIKK